MTEDESRLRVLNDMTLSDSLDDSEMDTLLQSGGVGELRPIKAGSKGVEVELQRLRGDVEALKGLSVEVSRPCVCRVGVDDVMWISLHGGGGLVRITQMNCRLLTWTWRVCVRACCV